jgi:hypothetical protein
MTADRAKGSPSRRGFPRAPARYRSGAVPQAGVYQRLKHELAGREVFAAKEPTAGVAPAGR